MSPAQACRQRDQPLGVPRQQLLVDPRLVVEPLQECRRDQVDQVAVAFLALAQQHQVVVPVRVRAALVPLLRDVHLAADDRLHPLLPRGVIELHRAEQVAMVGQRHGRHPLLGHRIHQLVDPARAIQQRVVRVAVQVNKRGIAHFVVKQYGSTEGRMRQPVSPVGLHQPHIQPVADCVRIPLEAAQRRQPLATLKACNRRLRRPHPARHLGLAQPRAMPGRDQLPCDREFGFESFIGPAECRLGLPFLLQAGDRAYRTSLPRSSASHSCPAPHSDFRVSHFCYMRAFDAATVL